MGYLPRDRNLGRHVAVVDVVVMSTTHRVVVPISFLVIAIAASLARVDLHFENMVDDPLSRI